MTFTASNGIPITTKVSGDGRSYLLGMTDAVTQAIASEEGIKALREFFQHEKDEQLGRWRSSADPRWTAVRRMNVVYFQCEDGERSFSIAVGHGETQKAWAPELQAIAREYLEAHPEPKPWHDANPGEVWELTTTESGATTYVTTLGVGAGGEEVVYFFPADKPTLPKLGKTASILTAGRRIYPEVS